MKGKEIKSYRIKLKMTQEDLTERFGVSANTIARWERDEGLPNAPGMIEPAFKALEIERGINADGEIAVRRKSVTKKLQSGVSIELYYKLVQLAPELNVRRTRWACAG